MKKDNFVPNGYSYTFENDLHYLKDENGNTVFVGDEEGLNHYVSLLVHKNNRSFIQEDYNGVQKDNIKIKKSKITNIVIYGGALAILTVPFMITGSMALISLPLIGTTTFVFSQKFLDAKHYFNNNEIRNYVALLEQEDENIRELELKVKEHNTLEKVR